MPRRGLHRRQHPRPSALPMRCVPQATRRAIAGRASPTTRYPSRSGPHPDCAQRCLIATTAIISCWARQRSLSQLLSDSRPSGGHTRKCDCFNFPFFQRHLVPVTGGSSAICALLCQEWRGAADPVASESRPAEPLRRYDRQPVRRAPVPFGGAELGRRRGEPGRPVTHR
jgi:hypothetical protein